MLASGSYVCHMFLSEVRMLIQCTQPTAVSRKQQCSNNQCSNTWTDW